MEQNKTMKKIKLYSRKTLALMLTMLMLMSCWVFTPIIEAEGAYTYDNYVVTINITINRDFACKNAYIAATFNDGTTEYVYNSDSNDAAYTYDTSAITVSNYRDDMEGDMYPFLSGSASGSGSTVTGTYSATFDKFPEDLSFGITQDGSDSTVWFTITNVSINGVDVDTTDYTLTGSSSASTYLISKSFAMDGDAPSPQAMVQMDIGDGVVRDTSQTAVYNATLTPDKTETQYFELSTFYFYDQYGVIMKEVVDTPVMNTYTTPSSLITYDIVLSQETGYTTVYLVIPPEAQNAGSTSLSSAGKVYVRVDDRDNNSGYGITYNFYIQDNDYTFTYNENYTGGSTTDQTANYDTTASYTEPTRDGYTFNGYFTNQDGTGTQLTTSTTLTADTTWYASWTANTYNVTIDKGDGETTTQTINHGESVTDLEDIAQTYDADGHTNHTGWLIYGDDTLYTTAQILTKEITEETTITAKFETAAHTMSTDGSSEAGEGVHGLDYYYCTECGYIERNSEITGYWVTTFEDEDGTTLDTVNTTMGSQFDSLEAPTAAEKADTDEFDYEFSHWALSTDEDQAAVDFTNYTPTQSETFIPVYSETKQTYTVTWQDADGGTLSSTEAVAYGTELTAPAKNPTKDSTDSETYTFVEWRYESETGEVFTTGDKVQGTTVLVPVFKSSAAQYTVTVQDENGTEIDSYAVDYNSTLTDVWDIAEQTKDKDDYNTYTFDKWVLVDENGEETQTEFDKDSTLITSNTTIKATFTPVPIVYTITWLEADGTTFETKTYGYDETIEAPTTPPEKTKTDEFTYEFKEWVYTDEDGKVFADTDTVTGNLTLTPTYDEITREYTITLSGVSDDEGNADTTITAKYGTTISTLLAEITPTKEKTDEFTYEFDVWVDGDDELTASQTVTGDITLTPKFTPTTKSYTITLSGVIDEETDKDTTIIAKYGTTISEAIKDITPTQDPTDESTFVFKSWVYGDDETDLGELTVTKDITITPTFTAVPIVYTITWLNADGKKFDSDEYSYGDLIVAPTTTPEKESTVSQTFAFENWVYITEDGGEDFDAADTVTGNLTLEPKFTPSPRTYTITLEGVTDGEKADTVITADYGTTIYDEIKNITPTKDNDGNLYYVFDGWKYSDETDLDNADTLESNVTLVPTFEGVIDTHTLTILSEDGTKTLGTITVADGTALEDVDFGELDFDKAEDKTNTYEFDKWLDENGNEVASTTEITSDTTIKPSYTSTAIEYTITWIDGNGDTFETQYYGYNDPITAPTGTPTKTATASETYTFTGWASYGETVTGSIEIQAVFATSATPYTVTVNDVNGVELAKYTVGYGLTLSDVEFDVDVSKGSDYYNTYAFDKWVDADGNEVTTSSVITEDITISPVFTPTPIVYTVTWLAADETTVFKSQDYGYNVTIIEPTEIPTKATANGVQYTFSHWEYKGTTTKFKETDVVTGNVELIPIFNSSTYEGETYTVTFYDEDGTTVLDTLEFIEGTALTQADVDALGTPTKDSDSSSAWVFTKWTDLDGNNISLPYGVLSDISLKANFERADEVIYTVTFEDYDGSIISTEEFSFNDFLYNIPTVESRQIGNSYYTFTGWKDEETGYTTIPERVTSDLTFVAQYIITGVTYTVTFANEDGTPLLDFLYTPSGSTVYYTGETPTKDATSSYCYTFIGWYDSILGGEEVTQITNVTSDVIVYARYTSTAHSFTTTTTKVATCTENGGTYSYCEYCGYERVTNIVTASGHNYTLINSTDLGDNTYEYTYLCKTCGEYYTTKYTEQQATAVPISLCYDDSAHTAINGAKITLYDENNTQLMYTYTDTTGQATIYIMTAGTYTIYITGTTFKDSFGTITMDENGNTTVEIEDIEMNDCSCTCHTDSFWATIFRFFHNILKVFTGGEISCCACPDESYYE